MQCIFVANVLQIENENEQHYKRSMRINFFG